LFGGGGINNGVVDFFFIKKVPMLMQGQEISMGKQPWKQQTMGKH